MGKTRDLFKKIRDTKVNVHAKMDIIKDRNGTDLTEKFGLGVQNEAEQTKANRVMPRECTVHSKHPLPTTQEKTLHVDITR